MAFVLSILYFLTYYLTPPVLFGALAQYRVELILAVIIVISSLPALFRSNVAKTSQTLALGGLAIATYMSVLVGEHWAGGGVTALLLFIPNAFAYLLVCLHCGTKRRVQAVILMMLFVCFFVIGNGLYERASGTLPTGEASRSSAMDNSYFVGESNQAGEWFYRLRGMGNINDPNDFAQLIVCTLPLLFFFWTEGKTARNFFFVLMPAAVLLYGAFMTHSRGSILALMAVFVVAVRRRIGLVKSIVLAGVLFVAAIALHYTGGRDISASAGEDRTALWGEGLQLLKSHPLFGVGYGNMPDYTGLTAHNTIVVCAAELGLLGLFCWSMFLLPSLRDALVVSAPKKVERGESVPLTDVVYPVEATALRIPDEAQIRRFGRLLVLSFTGFMVTGWFLSRAYVLTLFLLGGLTEVTFDMAKQRGIEIARMPLVRVLRYSAILTVAFIVMMYVLLRIVNLTR